MHYSGACHLCALIGHAQISGQKKVFFPLFKLANLVWSIDSKDILGYLTLFLADVANLPK